MIDLTVSSEAEHELARYEKYMTANKGMEIVTETYSIDMLPSHCIKLRLTLKKNYVKFTAEDYKEIIFKTPEVNQYIAYPFIIFLFGSLHLDIYVPKSAAEYMIKMVKYKRIGIRRKFVCCFKVAEEVMMNISQEPVIDIDKIPHTLFGQIIRAVEFEL